MHQDFIVLSKKSLYGRLRELPTLENHIVSCVSQEVYDPDIYSKYSLEEIRKADSFIDHSRDFLFTYAGLRQVVDKYLVQDRSGGGVYETPQFMYIMIALTNICRVSKRNKDELCRKILRSNQQTQNQHSHTYHGRGANSN